jgi:hypothetical protein
MLGNFSPISQVEPLRNKIALALNWEVALSFSFKPLYKHCSELVIDSIVRQAIKIQKEQ